MHRTLSSTQALELDIRKRTYSGDKEATREVHRSVEKEAHTPTGTQSDLMCGFVVEIRHGRIGS